MRNIIEHMGVQALVEYLPADKRPMVHTIGIKDPIYILAENGADAECQFQCEVEKYLETCKLTNKNPFLPIYGHIPAMDIEPKLHESLMLAARYHNKSVEDIIIEALEKYTE